jgi:hypothetical protein
MQKDHLAIENNHLLKSIIDKIHAIEGLKPLKYPSESARVPIWNHEMPIDKMEPRRKLIETCRDNIVMHTESDILPDNNERIFLHSKSSSIYSEE